MNPDLECYVGIDISKLSLDVAIRPSGTRKRFNNDDEGVQALADFLAPLKPKGVIMEATGGMETLAMLALSSKDIPCVLLNPRQARNFANAIGRLAKSDTIDADVLAYFGEAIKPQPRPMKDEQLRNLEALTTRRHQLVQMLTAEKNRLNSSPPRVRQNVKEHIEWLERQLDQINSDLKALIADNAVWAETDLILQSVPGVGPVSSLTFQTSLPELGTLDRKKIAALVGIAPLNRDSGASRRQRTVYGGRADVRAVLYMSTLCAIKFNDKIRPFYKRLIDAGKKPKVAITACMRKHLTILNAMVRDRVPWQVKAQTA